MVVGVVASGLAAVMSIVRAATRAFDDSSWWRSDHAGGLEKGFDLR